MPVHEVWEAVADTNQLNRYAGLFAVNFTPFQKDAKQIIRKGKATAFGVVPIEWIENVFEWVNESHYSVERIYTKGPLKRVIWKVIVEKVNENHTIMKLDGRFTYQNLFGKAALHIETLPQLRKMFNYVSMFEKTEKNYRKTAHFTPLAQVDEKRLTELAKQLGEILDEQRMIERLLFTLRMAPDDLVKKLQPYKWAEDFGFDRGKTIELFLLANEVGLVNYEWNMMCPNCRVPKNRVTSLRLVKTTVHCDLCGVDFEMDFDKYIEMIFTVHPSIRKVSNEVFCLNGPFNSPHIVGQFRIGPNEEKVVDWTPMTENLRMRVLKDNLQVQLGNVEDLQEQVIIYNSLGFVGERFNQAQQFRIINESEEEIVLAVEKVDWDSFALTAREVTSLQLFRNLLPAEVLAPGIEIGVSTLTVMFTDLKDSTRLYEEIGDSLAYADVKRHFDYLEKQISTHHGSIVKTIGDSVMAVFIKNEDALDAAIAIQQQMPDLNETLSHPVSIKVGFHAGPVIAVNANDVLDYFGRTVNMAARVQQQSTGDDIVITEEVYKTLSRKGTKVLPCDVEPFVVTLHGVDNHQSLYRLTVVK